MTTGGSGASSAAHVTGDAKATGDDAQAASDAETAKAAKAAKKAEAKAARPSDRAPRFVLVWAGFWTLLLAAVFVVYLVSEPFRHALPATIGTKIPVTVVWFGAMGGCLISLSGVVDFGTRGWDHAFDYWHPLRPILGMVMGSIGCLLLLITTDVSTKGSITTDPAFYNGVAFIFGYAEGSFRNLITKVTNVIVGPGPAVSPVPAGATGATAGGAPTTGGTLATTAGHAPTATGPTGTAPGPAPAAAGTAGATATPAP